jgi:hypothetical protein
VTEPQPVMAQAEQDQLTRQVGRALLTVAGADWQQVRAEYRSTGRHIEVDVFVKGPDGVERPVRPPQEVVDGLGRLRQGMYRPGRGTWLSALYVLDPPSSFSAEFEPDVEPRWRRVPPPIGFADELRFFPREDDHIPDWLRQRAGLPPLQEAEAPAGAPIPPGQGGAPARPGGMPPPPGPHAPPPGAPRPQGPPPGMPATPFGGQGDASPPRGFTAPGGPPFPPGRGSEHTPPTGFPAGPPTDQGAAPRNEPTPRQGIAIPAGPFTGPNTPPPPGQFNDQGAPPPRSEHTPPPGVPAGPFPGPAGPRPSGISIPAGPFTGGPTPPPARPYAGDGEPAQTPADHDNGRGPVTR